MITHSVSNILEYLDAKFPGDLWAYGWLRAYQGQLALECLSISFGRSSLSTYAALLIQQHAKLLLQYQRS